MKTNNANRTDERHGIEDVGAFTIATTPELFGLLSDGLYKDKILAPIRELACNAWDAHKETGKENEPFLVHLPNELEPWFSVRDFGPGLSHRNVLGLYTTYGGSTKQHTNDLIGGLGVGSKSPFAYSDSFTVVSFHNGEKRSYTAFKDADSRPNMAVMGAPEKSDEKTGMEISFPVSTRDFHSFYTRTQTILKRFDPLPEVVGGFDSFELVPVNYSYEGNGWKIGDDGHGSRAIQGNIAYKIDVGSIDDISDRQRSLLEMQIEIDFPIGSLDIAASREGLGYKPATIKALKEKADEIIEELQNKFNKEFKKIKTRWEAEVRYSSITADFKYLDLELKWRNEEISGDTIIMDRNQFKNFSFTTCKKRYTGSLEKKSTSFDVRVSPASSVGFVIDDLKTGVFSRVKEKLLSGHNEVPGKYHVIHIISPANKEDNKEFQDSVKLFFKLLGNPPKIKASDLPKPPRKETTTNQTKVFVRAPNSRYTDRERWDETEIDLNAGGHYVEIRNYRSLDLDKEPFYEKLNNYGSAIDGTEGRCIDKLVSKLVELDVIPDATEIYGVRTGDIKKMKGKWINVFELADKQIKKLIKKHDLAAHLRNKVTINEFDAPDIITRSSSDFNLKDGLFFDFMNTYNEMTKEVNTPNLVKITKLARVLKIDVSVKTTTNILTKKWTKVSAEYPLLELIEVSYRGLETEEIDKITDYIKLVDKS